MNSMRLILTAITVSGAFVFFGSSQVSAQYWCPTTLAGAADGCMMQCQASLGVDSIKSQKCWDGCGYYAEVFNAAGCVGKRVAKDSFTPGITEQCGATLSTLNNRCVAKCGPIPTAPSTPAAVALNLSCRKGCPFMMEELGKCEGKGLVRAR